MKMIPWGPSALPTSAIALGCMRLERYTPTEAARYLETAMDCGIRFFDHADIYGQGRCETLFGKALAETDIKREDIWIQSKCGIVSGVMYDFSKEHILKSVDGILERLNVEYLDSLLLHRPDALMEPEEVAEAFDILEAAGKVRHFGVSNHNPMQIELLKTAVKYPLGINQLQFSVTEAGMITSGMNANMKNADSVMHDGSVLEYSRIKNITIQTWSPFQYGFFKGTFIDSEEFPELNAKLAEIAEKYGISKTGVAAAWILRHPANMQVIAGTMNPDHLREICRGADVTLTRSEWYAIYRAAGHCLP